MRKNFKPQPWLYPMPVLIIGTYDEKGVPNAMNAAWGMISDMNKVTLCLAENHKTVKNIMEKKEFTISMANAENVAAADYVGITSGNNVPDKILKTGWNVTRSEFVDAPIFEELPVTLECKMLSYNEENALMTGEILNICIDESILDTNNKVDFKKFDPIAYDPFNHHYVIFGEKIADAYKIGKKLR